MKLMKFGGSSVADAERIRDVARIVREAEQDEPVIVVVSAFQGVTNQLLESAALAAEDSERCEQLYAKLAYRHRAVLRALLRRRNRPAEADVDAMLQELHDLLRGVYFLRECSPRTTDLIASFGERLAARIIAAFFASTKAAVYADSREFVKTDDRFTRAGVQFDQTGVKIRAHFKKLRKRGRFIGTPIVTGFIGSTADGRTTTIGRNGSDYSAAIVGAALDASIIEIWTDVDGVLSADPRTVASAFVLPQMSYEEAMELSYFGAKVLHAEAIAPAVEKKIPILIKNTMNPEAPGTLISREVESWSGVAKGISSMDDVTLLSLRGMSMVGVPGTSERLFRSLAKAAVNVILISQASSEHTICFAVNRADAARARQAITEEFRFEFHSHRAALDARQDQTIVAVVGEGMRGTPGVSGKVFGALGRNAVNVTAIAQGASERNISFVIDSVQRIRALNVIHEAFFERRKRLALVVVGTGNIGRALLQQLHLQRQFLLSRDFDVRVCGIANSRKFLLSAEGLDLQSWSRDLARSGHRMDLSEFMARVAQCEFTNAALVDCTASQDVVDAYPDFVKANLHIVTPNKRANVLPLKRYTGLMDLMRSREKYFLYEANVGAGLPVISTLQDLIASGDTIRKIEGIFSGTLSYLFNGYDGTRPFSAAVRDAHALGYTEPDPRDDLSGQDVARKLLILARLTGRAMDLRDVHVGSLVPKSLRRGPFDPQFFIRYGAFDAVVEKRYRQAVSNQAVLRYVAVLEGDNASAGMMELPGSHPFAATRGSDNIIAFTTQRYSRTPLVIQGPGAGADVTATGVFSDILKLLHYLPY